MRLNVLKQLDFVKRLHKPQDEPQSVENFRLFSLSSGTTISSSTSIDQSYIDSNPGPYTVEGGSETNLVTIDIVSDLVITSVDTYFIINSDYIIISTDEYVIYINDVPLYNGLIVNSNSSNILISRLTIKGNNSTLNPGAGWIASSSFGVNCSNNLIQYCNNYLPVSINSGGIVGRDSSVFTVGCNNFGELLKNPLYDYNYNYSAYSGGIYGRDCEGNADSCNNYGDINGTYSAGIIGQTDKKFNITYCENYGNINNDYSGGILGFFQSNPEFINSLTISDCANYGIIKGKRCGGIMFGNIPDSGSIVSIKNCFNDSAVTGQLSGGICSQLVNGIIDSCINYPSLKDYGIAGIVVFTLDVIVTKCENWGLITGDYFNSGIVVEAENTIISECKNYGAILSQYSAGILLFSFYNTTCKVIYCSNDGEVSGKDCGGILGRGSLANANGCTNSGSVSGEGSGGICGSGCGQSAVMENCINNGEVCGNNAGGIFGAWCTGTAKNCINAGGVTGVSTGGIFGEFSQGISDNSINNGHLFGVNTRNI